VIVVHGVYRFAQKRLAFRSDFCLACEAAQIAVQVRSFYVAHLYWVPLLPLGFWKTWLCSTCGRDPHARTRTKRFFKILLIFLLVPLAAAFWFINPDPHEAVTTWLMRLATVVGLGWATWWATYGHKPDLSLREQLARVEPYSKRTCPFCGGQLLDNPRWHCPACAMERSELGVRA
jgi:hypothetical protein